MIGEDKMDPNACLRDATEYLEAEDFVRDIMPNGTPDMDSSAEYRDVDWTEISDSWNEG
jgi:hypothetical protein